MIDRFAIFHQQVKAAQKIRRRPVKTTVKECDVCGETFKQKDSRQVVCSVSCGIKKAARISAEKQKAKPFFKCGHGAGPMNTHRFVRTFPTKDGGRRKTVIRRCKICDRERSRIYHLNVRGPKLRAETASRRILEAA